MWKFRKAELPGKVIPLESETSGDSDTTAGLSCLPFPCCHGHFHFDVSGHQRFEHPH